MFEFSVARKYLIPRWQQLSASVISLISVVVIALVVWLIVVFFSITHGLEKGWVEKLIALTAPIRITPTEQYYSSYYYKVDALSLHSDYEVKSIQEKLLALTSDPYDPEVDQEIPPDWPPPDCHVDGNLKDLVKLVWSATDAIDGVSASPYSLTPCRLKTQLEPKNTYPIFLNSFDPKNTYLANALLPNETGDVSFRGDLTSDPKRGEPLLLPKRFKEVGVSLLSPIEVLFYTPTLATLQEQQVSAYVAGFYDPGVVPMGSKMVIGTDLLASLIHASHMQTDASLTQGINIHLDTLDRVGEVKQLLVDRLKKNEIAPYWTVETYEEFAFIKDFLQQLKSERHLFSLLACVIMLVACSNIVSMLVILVNDKQEEIGVMRAMGATKSNIAIIFGLCGLFLGFIGSFLGISLAYLTLYNLEPLLQLISDIQGFELLNAHFYGETIPNAMSWNAVAFVLVLTVCTSLVSGIVPALKTCWMQPSKILKGGK